MTDLFDSVRDRARASTSAARSLVPLIAGGMKVTRRDLNDAMIAAYGGTDADGCWTQRDSCQSASKKDPLSASKRDPLRRAA